jgi:hypothetical protein
VSRSYRDQNEFVCLPRRLPAGLIDRMLSEVERELLHAAGAGPGYTVLLGLIEQSSSRLVCRLVANDPVRPPVELQLATHPGTLIVFNGDKLWHAVTPLGPARSGSASRSST